MTETPIYLVTPTAFDPPALAEKLDHVLAERVVGCVRLSLAAVDEAEWTRAAGPLREVTAARDIALVIADHYRLVAPLGLDGVHLGDQRFALREVRKALGNDRIVGAHAGASRHRGITLAEAGADYVSFGPVGDTGALGGEARADRELFQWWAEVIETPVVAEGAVGLAEAKALAGLADFIVPDPSIWQDRDPAAAVRRHVEALSGGQHPER